MASVKRNPGPLAGKAFKLGMVAATVVGLASLAWLHWVDLLTLYHVGFTLVFLFPVYLILAACLLSVWLGYDKDASDLRPVYRKREGT